MAILNAGIGALEHSGSPINPAVVLTTSSTFFDPDYCDRALALQNDSAYLWHTVSGVSTDYDELWFKCQMYLDGGASDLFFPIALFRLSNNEFIGTTSATGGFDTNTNIGGTLRSSSLSPAPPLNQLFEFALQLKAGEPARWYIDGVLAHTSVENLPNPMNFGSTVNSCRIQIRQPSSAVGQTYMSEMVLATEDVRGVRVRDMVLSTGFSAGTSDFEGLREPGTSVGNLSLGDGDEDMYLCTPVGSGTYPPIRSLFVAGSVSFQKEAVTRDRGGARLTLSSFDRYGLIANVGNGTAQSDGASLGLDIPFIPNGGATVDEPWLESDFADIDIGLEREASAPGTTSTYNSFQPVLLYGGGPPVDPLEGALVTQSVSYTVQQDREFLAPLFGAASSQAVSYGILRQTEPPNASQGISYTIGTVGEEPKASQSIGYTVFRDDQYLALVAGTKASAALSYTIYGPSGRPDASQAVSYIVGRLGDQPRSSSAISYVILGVGDPAALIQGIAYTVYAPAPPPPYRSSIIIGRSRY